jgi:signal peptidase
MLDGHRTQERVSVVENRYANCQSSKSPLRLLTKGDNNLADDTELYAKGQSFLNRKEDVVGSVVGFIPFVGYVTILLSEHPWLKQVMLGIMGLMVVLQRE